jgi:hypothetical protein
MSQGKTVHCTDYTHYLAEQLEDCRGYEYTVHHCTHTDNVLWKGNWLARWKKYKKSPHKLNKRMDCVNFKAKYGES